MNILLQFFFKKQEDIFKIYFKYKLRLDENTILKTTTFFAIIVKRCGFSFQWNLNEAILKPGFVVKIIS